MKMKLFASIFRLTCAYFLGIGVFALACSGISLIGRITGVSMRTHYARYSNFSSYYEVFLFISSVTLMCTSYAVSYHIVAFITSAF